MNRHHRNNSARDVDLTRHHEPSDLARRKPAGVTVTGFIARDSSCAPRQSVESDLQRVTVLPREFGKV
jgi:hypothetical protein